MTGHQQIDWEYRAAKELDDAGLNELGSSGWELVAVENGIFYLKRPRLSFTERVTLDQKRRYYALWNVAAGNEGANR
jgi:hypothetical protein